MNNSYAKVVVQGSPITKSNFKLFNTNGRAILPYNSGKYHDRYAIYEEEISYAAKSQNPNTVLDEGLIAILKVYYKSSKRHPDTNNITKSIFDGIEKSGLIVNDAQIKTIYIEEFYDKENPRFELELFGESEYEISCKIIPREVKINKTIYSPASNKKRSIKITSSDKNIITCDFCNKSIKSDDYIKANNGKTFICKSCFKKSF
ncbi:MAG: RusA family crossover junction endodeoxyribonuclease [Clostridiaceae bacterium]